MRCNVASSVGRVLSRWPANQPQYEDARAGALDGRYQLQYARRISCGTRVLRQVHVVSCG